MPESSSSKKHNRNLYLRKLVIGQDYNNSQANSRDDEMDTTTTTTSEESPQINGSENGGESSCLTKKWKNNVCSDVTTTTAPLDSLTQDKNQIIEALKLRLREYEQQHTNNKSKCLICMDEFRIPVVSICCWHVHCEECWLRTLGTRKLCPQCNMITSPTDLRRIYM